MTYEYTDFAPSEQDKITHLRNQGLFVYHLRDQEGSNFTIERRVLVNRIGFLITDTDILRENDCITNKEFSDMHGTEGRLCNYER